MNFSFWLFVGFIALIIFAVLWDGGIKRQRGKKRSEGDLTAETGHHGGGPKRQDGTQTDHVDDGSFDGGGD